MKHNWIGWVLAVFGLLLAACTPLLAPAATQVNLPAQPGDTPAAISTLAGASSAIPTIPGGLGVDVLLKKGHTLEQHVGKNEAFLRARLKNENISAASTYYDLPIAYASVGAALNSEWKRIQTWQRSKSNERYVFDYIYTQPVGVTLQRGASKTMPTSDLRLVLVKDSSALGGFFILTTYPQ
jgi:filamentous hemagglutinin